MNFSKLIEIFSGIQCQKIYVKKLAANDNSKNQVYLGGSFDILNIFPLGPIETDFGGDRKRESFKSKLDFSWVDLEGLVFHAPAAQLILYPDYPEIRFSGFLKGCRRAPSELMRSREENRILFLGVSPSKKIYGFVANIDSELVREFFSYQNLETHGVFTVITLSANKVEVNSKSILLKELRRINELGWIESKRLTPSLSVIPCKSPNCGGFTLEAELNIPSNSIAKPDFLGWEVKQFRVTNFNNIGSTVVSLMDHSPTHGFFKENGVEAFIRKYGYDDRQGRASRMNFGGVHKFGINHHLTNLNLITQGFDLEKQKILTADGYVALIDSHDNIAASWSFASIIEHWTTKHAKACYVPSQLRVLEENQQYAFGNKVILGIYTDVTLFLTQLCLGKIYFDPGIKLEFSIANERKKSTKVRSLFRIKSGDISSLYRSNEIVDLKEM